MSVLDMSVEEFANSLFGDDSYDSQTVESLFTKEEAEEFGVEEYLDDSLTTEELSYNAGILFGKVETLTLALRAAEEFIWSSTEADESEVDDDDDDDSTASEGIKDVWDKFWNWIKDIWKSAIQGIVNIAKKVQIWMAGDLVKLAAWFKSNEDDAVKAINGKGGKETISDYSYNAAIFSEVKFDSRVYEVAIANLGSNDAIKITVDKIKDRLDEDKKNKCLNAFIYSTKGSEVCKKGFKPSKTSLTINKWFKQVGGYSEFEKGCGNVKQNYSKIMNQISTVKTALKNASKAAKIDASSEQGKLNKRLAGYINSFISFYNTITIGLTLKKIHVLQAGKRYAQKAIKVGK